MVKMGTQDSQRDAVEEVQTVPPPPECHSEARPVKNRTSMQQRRWFGNRHKECADACCAPSSKPMTSIAPTRPTIVTPDDEAGEWTMIGKKRNKMMKNLKGCNPQISCKMERSFKVVYENTASNVKETTN